MANAIQNTLKTDDNAMDLKPLNSLQNGQKGTVMSLAGGNEFQSRIISMGIFPGCEIMVLKNRICSKGPILTAVGDSRIMIGQGMTAKILVEIDNDEQP